MLRLFIFLFFISSCTYAVHVPANVNKILITYHNPNNRDGVSFTETNMETIDLFRKVLENKPIESTCKATGAIDFISGDSTILHFGFSLTPPSCVFLIKDEKSWRLSYRAGMYLDYAIEKHFKSK